LSNDVYTFLEHTDGWAYQVDGAVSPVFPSLDAAREAARLVEIKKSHAANGNRIVFEDAFGQWQEPLHDGMAI
jgi:hypothetical protein